jgi:hypothetical protein
MDQRPFLIALRVLGRAGLGLTASPADQRALRHSVRLRERKVALEELCYVILKRELNPPKLRQLEDDAISDLDDLIRKFSHERAELTKIISSLKYFAAQQK